MRTLLFKTRFNKMALAILCILFNCCVFAQSVPLPNAFAHNDYSHKRPLHDALANGYTNIEADVFYDFTVTESKICRPFGRIETCNENIICAIRFHFIET